MEGLKRVMRISLQRKQWNNIGDRVLPVTNIIMNRRYKNSESIKIIKSLYLAGI